MVLASDFNFPFVPSTPFNMCFAMHLYTTHSKSILSFFALFNWMNGTIKFFKLFLLIFFEDGRPTTVNAAHLVFFFSKTRKSMTMPISASKKENQKRRLFLHYKCCVCTKTVFSFLLDEIGWFKDNRQIYLKDFQK